MLWRFPRFPSFVHERSGSEVGERMERDPTHPW